MRSLYKILVVLGFFLTIPFVHLFAQVGINADNSAPDASAGLDVNFSNKGMLIPRMTFDLRNAITNPAEGLMVFCINCTTNGALSIYSNGAWRSFTPCNTPTSSTENNVVSPGQIIWNWTAVPGATSYKWNTTENYGTALDMLAATTKTETGIICGTTHNRYVWTNNECGISIPIVLSHSVPASAPLSPAAGTPTAALWSIVWNWNTTPGATGYKWNTVDNFATATEMLMTTTKSETGLLCNTPYTRYVWAYNGCGVSVSVALVQSTLICTSCGTSITINHVASGGIAPVDKTVTYGTATNIPGELTKCWITRNLGAAEQATVVSDATEPSAGWYFQFNRKQGYKHDGTTRTPSTAWNATNDNLSATWEAAKDPCTIELGTSWRIPTKTEWTNVDASGDWTNWNGPYDSALKLHAAGNLSFSDGSLYGRGTNGYYCSSMQYDATNGWLLYFGSGFSYKNYSLKSLGFSARCVRDF